MWKSLTRFIFSNLTRNLLNSENVSQQQLRTTFILKRLHPPRLHKKGTEPKKMRAKNYIYDLVKDTNMEKQPLMDIILTSYVDGLGNVGDKISLKRNYAYTNLILPGLAVYASPENIEKYKSKEKEHEKERHSSPKALFTCTTLSRLSLAIVMNQDVPWTIKPWHIRASFRKCGFIVPEEAITMLGKPITGPDLNLEGKEFLIQVTINKTETQKVRCKIHHWSTDSTNRLPYTPEFYRQPPEAVFPEELPIIRELYEIKLKSLDRKKT